MSNTQLTESAKQMLIGRRIHEVGDNYIKLDNGHHIYLTDEEIESLNPYEDEADIRAESFNIERNEEGDALVVGCAKCGHDVYETNDHGHCRKCAH